VEEANEEAVKGSADEETERRDTTTVSDRGSEQREEVVEVA
jgi:hypothetical protein